MTHNANNCECLRHEDKLRKTAELYAYLISNLRTLPHGERWNAAHITNVVHASQDAYCNVNYTPELYKTLTELLSVDPHTFDDIVYNARSRQSRDLATWWEDQVYVDSEHRRKQAEQIRRDRRRIELLSQLTAEDRDILGIK